MTQLGRVVKCKISTVRVIPLHGSPLHGSAQDCVSVPDAVSFVENYNEKTVRDSLVKYEIAIRYDNHDKIQAELHDKMTAIDFLQAYQT
jgi:hypothetical protein